LKAQLHGFQLLLLMAGKGSGLSRLRSRERGLQRGDAVAMLTFSLQ